MEADVKGRRDVTITRFVALFGDPVAGNPTSRVQNAAFEVAGLDWRYLDFRVPAEELAAAIEAARTLRFEGWNLTIPHKVAVVPLLDELDPSARITGAVNTVKRDPDGRLRGSNTDGSGFMAALRDAGVGVSGIEAVLLGAGGAARAVAVELARAGATAITIVNRDAARGDAVVELLRDHTPAAARRIGWESPLPPCDLLVNCTPIGMGTGRAAEELPPVDLAALPREAIVCDLNPDRRESAFLRAANARGHRTLGGLPMIARLSAACFELWTGRPAPLDVMEAELERSSSV
jgi:shikimate dehydrogenase